MPLYTVEDVKKALPRFEVKPYDTIFHLGNGIKYRFLDAGHILGSGSLEVWFQDSGEEKKIVFSGDIGKKGNPIIRDPSAPIEPDFIVMESTYGNRRHKPLKDSIDELVQANQNDVQERWQCLYPVIRRWQDAGPALYPEQPCEREKTSRYSCVP